VSDGIDAVSRALETGSPLAAGAVFLAGVASSIGPCIAPRYLAIAGFSSGAGRPTRAAIAFVGGLIVAYAVLGWSAGWIGSLHALSGIVDIVMGVALAGAGIAMIWGAEPTTERACTHVASTRTPFLLGAASAFVVSPCCTPVLAAIVVTASALGKPIAGTLLLVCFALGHALPLFAAGSLAGITRRMPLTGALAQCPAIIGGSLLLSLGAFYGAIA